MNIQTKWKNGRALNENESYQLIDDLFAEQVDMNKDKRKDISQFFTGLSCSCFMKRAL